jgi:DNA-binding transcriptional LysR family regulator
MKSLNSIDLNLLKVLISIYHHRNLTKAGEKLGMSQPAVSRSLERINSIFGERLFIRSNGEMKPSRTAESIVPEIEEALFKIEKTLNSSHKFDPINLKTSIKIGLNDYCLSTFAPKLISQIRKKAPNLSISIVPTNYIDAPNMIQKGELNCAVVSSLNDSYGLSYEPLFKEDYVVILNPNLFKEIKTLNLETYLISEHLLVSYTGGFSGWIDEELRKSGFSRNLSLSVHSFSSVPHILTHTALMCAVPRKLGELFSEQFGLKLFELPFENLTHTFYMICNKKLHNNVLSNWLRTEFTECTKNM